MHVFEHQRDGGSGLPVHPEVVHNILPARQKRENLLRTGKHFINVQRQLYPLPLISIEH